MTTKAEAAKTAAQHDGWSDKKVAAFFEHCKDRGYNLDEEHHIAGSGLQAVMMGFEMFVWDEKIKPRRSADHDLQVYGLSAWESSFCGVTD